MDSFKDNVNFQRVLDLVPEDRRDQVKEFADALDITEGSELFPMLIAMGSFTVSLKEFPKKLDASLNIFDKTAARIQGVGNKVSLDVDRAEKINSTLLQTFSVIDTAAKAFSETKLNKQFFQYMLVSFGCGTLLGALLCVILYRCH